MNKNIRSSSRGHADTDEDTASRDREGIRDESMEFGFPNGGNQILLSLSWPPPADRQAIHAELAAKLEPLGSPKALFLALECCRAYDVPPPKWVYEGVYFILLNQQG